MAIPPIPIKTSDGLAELNSRQRRLSQRHRTLLLLVDGRRTAEEVRQLAQQAGSAESCFSELLELGMISLPEPTSPPPMSTVPIAPPPGAEPPPLHVDIPLDDDATDAPAQASATEALDSDSESLLPAAGTLHPESMAGESMLGDSQVSESGLRDFEAFEASRTEDTALEEARAILLRAVRKEAPLAGSLTIRRLRRARTRNELAALIREVEARVIKPYRSLAAQQDLRRARELLAERVDSVQPAS